MLSWPERGNITLEAIWCDKSILFMLRRSPWLITGLIRIGDVPGSAVHSVRYHTGGVLGINVDSFVMVAMGKVADSCS